METTTFAPSDLDTNQPMTPEGSVDYVTEDYDTTTLAMTPGGSVTPCNMECPLVRDLVCGTDGVTYQSRCVLEAEACRRGDTNLSVAYPGPCLVTLSPNVDGTTPQLP